MLTIRPLISTAHRLAYRAWCAIFGYVIHSDDFNATHYARTWTEALEWAQCYMTDDFVVIRRRGSLCAIRGV